MRLIDYQEHFQISLLADLWYEDRVETRTALLRVHIHMGLRKSWAVRRKKLSLFIIGYRGVLTVFFSPSLSTASSLSL